MTARLVDGQIEWELEIDEEGHRNYTIKHYVEVDDSGDGPAIVSLLDTLPQVGDTWDFDNDADEWAFCYPNMKIKKHEAYREGDPVFIFSVEQKFSTKPLSKCTYDLPVGDPLLEPDKFKGNFSKYTKEAIFDRFGNPVRSSSHEQIRGSNVEIDKNRASVKIEQNVASLDLYALALMIDTLNDAPLWGLPARCIKLSNVSWERKLYGFCNFYFTRELEFEIDALTWDRKVVDEGDKVLNGHWSAGATGSGALGDWIIDNIDGAPPDPDNPSHFVRAKDRNGENMHLILNGAGLPADSVDEFGNLAGSGTFGGPAYQILQFYDESDFLELGVPVEFDAVEVKTIPVVEGG